MINLFQKLIKPSITISTALLIMITLSACSNDKTSETKTGDTPVKTTSTNKEKEVILKNNISLSAERGTVRENVDFKIVDLDPNSPVQLTWNEVDGKYTIKDLYTVVGPEFTEKEIVLVEGKSNENGEWQGNFTVPEGFGGDFTVFVKQDNTKIGQVGYTVDPTFTMIPESGPVGTEIIIKMEGLGWSTYMRNWQLTYDNKYTGLITAISTNGSAEAKIRAAGTPGKHTVRLRTGYLGMQYINYLQSPYPDKPAPDFIFEITDEKVVIENFVEPIPVAADGGVEMPKLIAKDNVKVSLDINEGTVGTPIKMTASGLPKDKEVELIWNTMRGSRVSGLDFAEESRILETVKTDSAGNISYIFPVPNDLGGIPHRIDLKIADDIYAQEYLRILPSIISFEPKSGPVGTKINITIKGGGWTEFDNAYYVTYDNAYTGYLCAFNSQGNLTFDVVASGDLGYHLIDLYPGIYKQEIKDTDMTLIPQLTYSTDHPGSAIPAIRLGFEITE